MANEARTVFATVSGMTPQYFADFVISNLYANCYFRQIGTLVTVPVGHGTSVKIPRWGQIARTDSKGNYGASAGQTSPKYSPSAVAITAEKRDIITPGGLSARANVSGIIQTFVGAKSYNDLIVIANRTDFLEGAYEVLSRELAMKVDRHVKASISGSMALKTISASYARPALAKTGTGSVLRSKHIAMLPGWLDTANIPRWEDDTFVAIGHPLIQYDLFADTSANGFVALTQYGDPTRAYKGEVGTLWGVRLLLSPSVTRTLGAAGASSGSYGLSGSATGANLWVFSPDSFYNLEFDGGGLEVIHHELGSAGAWDPGNNIGSVGVKLFFGVAPSPSQDRRYMRLAHGFGLTY